jgi:16S rRNA (guanine527-N7)-methyltransferase
LRCERLRVNEKLRGGLAVGASIQDESLEQALSRYELKLPGEQVERIQQYCELLWDWNQKFNLTRHTTFDLFVTRDLCDTQHLSEQLESGARVLDWGSGGGVPGLLLALLRPDLKVELSECIGKKSQALQDMVRKLRVPVTVHTRHLERVLERPRAHYEAVTARAIGPLWKMLRTLRPYWSIVDGLYTIKGPRWVEERGEARHRGLLSDLELRKLSEYRSPGEESRESVILRIRPT